jgi:uncharacterized protein (TIGR02145 family)
MRKIYLTITFIASILLSGCTHEGLIDDKLPSEQATDGIAGSVITFTASTPGGDSPAPHGVAASTRVALEQEASTNIRLTWEEGDQLHLLLVYTAAGEEKTDRQVVEVTNIREGGKQADFSISLPSDITETFNLYGVYGGGGLDAENPKLAVLPAAGESVAGSLAELQASKTVMLRFATEVNTSSPAFSVNFEHVGSLFNIQLENTGTSTLSGIKQARLVAESTIGAHNNSGSARFDVISGTFTGTASPNELPFELASPVDLAQGAVIEFWGWYPPVAEEAWPALSIEVLNSEGVSLATSSNSKPARSAATAAGRAFYLIAEWDGNQISFDSGVHFPNNTGTIYFDEFTPYNDAQTNDTWTLTDRRDGKGYAVKRMADGRYWMVQDLRFGGSPDIVTSKNTFATDDPATAGILGENIPDWYGDIVNNTAYTNGNPVPVRPSRGYFYNWRAAMQQADITTGEAYSGTQGIAPGGWHIPTVDEYKALRDVIGINGIAWGENPASLWKGIWGGTIDPGNTPPSHYGGWGEYGYYWTSTNTMPVEGGSNAMGNHQAVVWRINSPSIDEANVNIFIEDNPAGVAEPAKKNKNGGALIRCIMDYSPAI